MRYDLPAMVRRKTKRKTIILPPIEPTIALRTGIYRALNSIIARAFQFACETIMPDVAIERRRYHADDFQNIRDHIEELRRQMAAAEIAASQVGVDRLEQLHALLAEDDFPRRDNLVAFLHYLGDERSAHLLEQFLIDPPAFRSDPNAERALLLAAPALGRIAGRGSAAACLRFRPRPPTAWTPIAENALRSRTSPAW